MASGTDKITISIRVPQPVRFRWRRTWFSLLPSMVAVCGRHSNVYILMGVEKKSWWFVPPCCWIDANRKYGRTKEWLFWGRSLIDAMKEAQQQFEVQEEIWKLGHA